MTRPRTLYEKIWDAHVVEQRPDGTCLIFIDRHLVHEVTSPQAFAGLRANGRTVRRPDLTLAVPDHNLPTTARKDARGNILPIADAESAAQLATLETNASEFGVRYIDAVAPEQGIVHVVGPEQGFSLPGTTIVCGDSHTACHGGIGALAFLTLATWIANAAWKLNVVHLAHTGGVLLQEQLQGPGHPGAHAEASPAGSHWYGQPATTFIRGNSSASARTAKSCAGMSRVSVPPAARSRSSTRERAGSPAAPPLGSPRPHPSNSV